MWKQENVGTEVQTRAVTPPPTQSLFHRVQLDPLEKDWMRSSALGNTAVQRQLLAQEPSLVFRKVGRCGEHVDTAAV